ncbi:ATP-binding protein, partial [bacterium]|nr:ATP-binding protein [bacterium]
RLFLGAVNIINIMLNDIKNCSEVEVSKQVKLLEEFLDLDTVKEISSNKETRVTPEDLSETPESEDSEILSFLQKHQFEVIESDYQDLDPEFQFFYSLKYNLNDLEEVGSNILSLEQELSVTGKILSSALVCASFDFKVSLADPCELYMIYASRIDPEVISLMSGLEESNIHELSSEQIQSFYKKEVEENSENSKVNSVMNKEELMDSKIEIDEICASEMSLDSSESQIDGDEDLKAKIKELLNKKKVIQSVEVKELDQKAPEQKLAKEVELQNDQKEESKSLQKPAKSKQDSIRIPTTLLDELMRLAGELVLIRNQQLTMVDKEEHLRSANNQRLDIVTTELQETIMRTRMQKIGHVFSRFALVVRSLSRKLEKEISFNTEGNEVELDNNILEALVEPLTHIIRNSCDHGIEMPDFRENSGKARNGTISLSAFHEGGMITIRISDDGGGIDPEKIREKVVEKGIKSDIEAEKLSQKELLNLILLPGFSTVEEVSDLSGRGVGMDVVKSSIESQGGVLEIDSELGKGTTLSLRIPLTLAIIPSLIVNIENHRFAIPQINVEELVRLYDEDVKNKIETAVEKSITD